jgi:trans-aconitate methyltransferase
MTEAPVPDGWDGRAYAAASGHHRAADEWFLDRHPPAPGDTVVDVGCGTGDFTALLAGLVGHGHVSGVDPDGSMLAQARQHELPNLTFVQGRAQDLDRLLPAGSADLLVSRAVFHWIPLAEYGRCYEAARVVLRPGGWLHFESGGAGNVAGPTRLLEAIGARFGLGAARATYPDAGTVLELLEQAGFEIPPDGVRTVAQRRSFDRDELLGWVRTQPLHAYAAKLSEPARAELWAELVGRLDELRRADGSWDQTFVRLDVLARRPWERG